jgi:peptidoglycan/LPS O-acetylase OafA/YrhL
MGVLRFLLAMSVVVTHVGALFGLKMLPGFVAVEIFFVVSGFYMSLILSGKYADVGAFYSNRFLRLYPTYLIILAGTLGWYGVSWLYLGRPPTNDMVPLYAGLPWWQSGLIWFSNLTMIGLDIPSLFHYRPDLGFMFMHDPNAGVAADGALWAGNFRWVGQAWSIGLEIWFYISAPFLARLRSRWLIGIGLASLALRLSLPHTFAYFLFPAQLYLFVLGMLLHRFYVARRLDMWPRRYGWLALAYTVAVILTYQWLPKPARDVLVYGGVALLTPVLFALTHRSAFDTALGNLSYPIYLSHMLVGQVVANVLGSERPLLIAVLTVAVSIGLYLIVERPVDRYRQARLKRLTAKAAANAREPAPVSEAAAS